MPNSPVVPTFWRESWVRPIAGELSNHGVRQLAHDLALVSGDLFLHRGINPIEKFVVFVLS